MKNTYVLAFDCSTQAASVALNGHRKKLHYGQQAAELVPAIESLLAEEGIHYADLDCIVTSVGPGSFTGLRIALATLHGLVQASGVPIKLLTASQAVAWAVCDGHFLVALNAGKGEVFMQEFMVKEGVPVAVSEMMLKPQEAIRYNELRCYSNLLPVEHPHYIDGPDAAVMALIAPQLPVAPLEEAVPYYIREADAKIPEKPDWLK